jgi:hypothetical protein
MWPLDLLMILFNWEQGIDMPGAPLLVVFWDSSSEGQHYSYSQDASAKDFCTCVDPVNHNFVA